LVEGDSAGGGCFVSNTKVWTTSGEKTMAQLVADHSVGITNYGMAWDLSSGNQVQFEIDSPRVTKMTTTIVVLTTETGDVIKCTPEHLFLLKSGEYKAAIDLTEDDEIQEVRRS
jgi:DNA gyrase subunit B